MFYVVYDIVPLLKEFSRGSNLNNSAQKKKKKKKKKKKYSLYVYI